MKIEEAISILEYHNKWRRSEEAEMISPVLIGEAIDTVVDYFKKIRQKELIQSMISTDEKDCLYEK